MTLIAGLTFKLTLRDTDLACGDTMMLERVGLSRVAADKAANLGGEDPSAVSCLQTASIPDARTGNDA